MCRMLGAICNDEDLLSCAIEEVKDSLRCEDGETHDGIGVGFYSQDDALLTKKPSAKVAEIDFVSLVEGIVSNVLMVHIRKATVGVWKDINTHPFRFRKWLFAHVGHLPQLEKNKEALLADMPPFLARDIKGDTDSELAFHVFLNVIFKHGKINDLSMEVGLLDEYLRETVAIINQQHEEAKRPELAILVTNGEVMSAASQGIAMHYSLREGILECPRCEKSDQQKHIHGRFKGVMVGAAMSNPGHQWREVADGSLLHISKDLELKVQQL